MIHYPSHTNSIDRRTSIGTCLRTLFLSIILMCGIAINSSDAVAQSLDAARSSGMVGEQSDGYAVARPNATAAARKLVNRVNSQRRKIYTKRAREQRISPAQVGKLYASKIMAKAPKGTWIQASSGGWKRK